MKTLLFTLVFALTSFLGNANNCANPTGETDVKMVNYESSEFKFYLENNKEFSVKESLVGIEDPFNNLSLEANANKCFSLNTLLIDNHLIRPYGNYSEKESPIYGLRPNNSYLGTFRSLEFLIWDLLLSSQVEDHTFSDIADTLQYPSYNNYDVRSIIFEQTSDKVVICGGSYSKKYHKDSNCKGLSNCKGGLYEVSKSEAVNKGRTACLICY